MSSSEERRGLTIAIDGPAGAGKSTLAKILAHRLGYLYIDTGAMYRALAVKALRDGIDVHDDNALAAMAAETSVELQRTPSGGNRVLLDGEDVTNAIREPAVDRVVSRVSSSMGLRDHMVQAQRKTAQGGGVVMDGRDIGNNVLPHAERKFFLTASLEERARRRQSQQIQAGHEVPLQQLESEMARRDEQDQNKGSGSLIQTEDSLLIDTTGRSVEEVIVELLSYCRRD